MNNIQKIFEKNPFLVNSGEKGMNSTSAQQVCAIASQVKAQAEEFISRISFVNEYLDVVGTDSKEKLTHKGFSEEKFNEIDGAIRKISDANRVISWFSEARKYLESVKRAINNTSFNEWFEWKGYHIDIEVGEYPEIPSEYTIEEAIATLDIKQRELYHYLESKSAVLGNIIHSGNRFDIARKAAFAAISDEYSVNGTGKDTVISHKELSIPIEKIDEKFFALQKEYRETEQNLNHIKGELRDAVVKENLRLTAEYSEDVDMYNRRAQEYDARKSRYLNEFNTWKLNLSQEFAKKRFAVPDVLWPIITELNSYGDGK